MLGGQLFVGSIYDPLSVDGGAEGERRFALKNSSKSNTPPLFGAAPPLLRFPLLGFEAVALCEFKVNIARCGGGCFLGEKALIPLQ